MILTTSDRFLSLLPAATHCPAPGNLPAIHKRRPLPLDAQCTVTHGALFIRFDILAKTDEIGKVIQIKVTIQSYIVVIE